MAELLDQFAGDGALTRRDQWVVEGGHHGGAGAVGLNLRGAGGVVVGVAAHHEAHMVAAEEADAVALLARGGGGHVHGAGDAQPCAGPGHALAVVAGGGTDHAGALLVVGQLADEGVGAAQLIAAHRLQVFALEPDATARGRGNAFVVLQRGDSGDAGKALGGLVNEMGERGYLGSGHPLIVQDAAGVGLSIAGERRGWWASRGTC